MDPFGSGFDGAGDGFDLGFLLAGGFIALVGILVVVFVIVFFIRAARGKMQPPTIIVRTENGDPVSDEVAAAAISRRRGIMRNQELLNAQLNQTNQQNMLNQQNLLNEQNLLNQQTIINQQNNGTL